MWCVVSIIFFWHVVCCFYSLFLVCGVLFQLSIYGMWHVVSILFFWHVACCFNPLFMVCGVLFQFSFYGMWCVVSILYVLGDLKANYKVCMGSMSAFFLRQINKSYRFKEMVYNFVPPLCASSILDKEI
jgi:hypothetical protein